jgi:methionyl-tRNA formyltransferase
MRDKKTPTLRIVFMGTPEFAVASLRALIEDGHDIAAVVTAPDKPSGRGLQLTESAVKRFAVEHNLPVLQPEKLKDPQFLESLRALNADLFVVVAFRMLPEVVWSMPPKGTINLHGSLLPKYRGAAPIQRAIMNGEKETGVTTFFLQQEIDTGKIIARERIPIGPDETAGELHDRMMDIGSACLAHTVNLIARDEAVGVDQDAHIAAGEELVHAPKIFREDCRIDWDQSTDKVHNHIRGLSPYPSAWTLFEGKTLKVLSGKKEHEIHDQLPGTWESDGKTFLRFATGDGWYIIHRLQLEGKKAMDVDEFLRGWKR